MRLLDIALVLAHLTQAQYLLQKGELCPFALQKPLPSGSGRSIVLSLLAYAAPIFGTQ